MLNYTVEEDLGENLSEKPNENGVYEKVEAQADRYVEYFKISVEAAKKYPNGLAAIKKFQNRSYYIVIEQTVRHSTLRLKIIKSSRRIFKTFPQS